MLRICRLLPNRPAQARKFLNIQSEVSMLKVSPKFPGNIQAYVTVQRGIVHKRETKSRLKCKRTGRQLERTRMNTSVQVSVYVNSSVLSLVVTNHSLPP
jgi:hypothetical protein